MSLSWVQVTLSPLDSTSALALGATVMIAPAQARQAMATAMASCLGIRTLIITFPSIVFVVIPPN